jgi:hypothetical protein
MLVPPSYLDSWCITVKKSRFEKHRGPAWVCALLCKLQKGCTPLVAANDKVYQLLAHGRWFSSGSPTSSTTKSGRHDIAEVFLKVALNTKNQSIIWKTQYNFENRNIMRFFLQGISLSICYLDVNWLIPKISACQVRIWSLLASERSERVTNFIFCRASWYFFRLNHIHIQMTCLSSLNQTKTWIYGTSIPVGICIYVRQNTLQNIVRK